MSLSYFDYVAIISCIIPFIVGLYLYFKLDTAMKFLLLLFGIGLLVDALGYYLYSYTKFRDTLWLFHLYTLMEYSLLILIFSYMQKNIKLKRIFLVSIPGFVVLWISAKLFFEDFSQSDSYTSSFACVLLVAVSFSTLYALGKEYFDNIFRDPRFWVGSAVLIYFSGNLLTFALGNIIIDLSFHHSLMSLISNLFYTGGFLCLHPRLNYGGLLSSAL